MGIYYVSSGETVSGVTLDSGDQQYVLSGGTAIGTAVNSGSFETVSAGGLTSGTVVSGGNELVYGTTRNTVLRGGGGGEAVFSGGITSGTVVGSGIGETVYAGGTTSGTVVSSGGGEFVDGTTRDTVLRGGFQQVNAGGTAGGTVVSSGASEFVDGTVRGTVLRGGYEAVFSGGTTSGMTLSSGGTEVVHGTTIGTVVSSGGTQAVYAQGTTTGTVVSRGGIETVGGHATGTVASGGGLVEVLSGASAIGSVVESGGTETVFAGGRTTNTMVSSAGVETVAGTAINTVVNGGGTVVDDGTLAFVGASTLTEQGIITGAGALVLSGPGTVVLAGQDNTYAGGTRIRAGVLDLTVPGAAGTGAIAFIHDTSATAALRIEPGSTPVNSIRGFLPGEVIDLAGIGLATSATLGAHNALTISGGGGGPVTLQLDPGQSYAGYAFRLEADGRGGTNVTVVPAASSEHEIGQNLTGTQFHQEDNMATKTWNGGTGDIASADSWTPPGAPQPGDVARISSGTAVGQSQDIQYGISLGGPDPDNRPVVQLTDSTIGPQGYVQSVTSFAPGIGVEFGQLVAQGTTTVQGSLAGGSDGISTPGQLKVGIADAPGTNGMTSSPGVLVNDGRIEASGVPAQALGDGGVDIEAASPDAHLVNDGTIQTFGGITLNAPVNGTGQINVENSGILSEGDILVGGSVSQGQTVNLIGDGNEIVLFQPAQFQGLITGFDSPTDDILLPNTPAVTSYNFDNGVLTLQNGTDTVAALRFSGTYQTSDFVVKSQNGGTTITTTAVPPEVGGGQGTQSGGTFNLAAEIQQVVASFRTIEDLVVSILRSTSAALGGTSFGSASLQPNNVPCGSMPAMQTGQQTSSLVPHFGS